MKTIHASSLFAFVLVAVGSASSALAAGQPCASVEASADCTLCLGVDCHVACDALDVGATCDLEHGICVNAALDAQVACEPDAVAECVAAAEADCNADCQADCQPGCVLSCLGSLDPIGCELNCITGCLPGCEATCGAEALVACQVQAALDCQVDLDAALLQCANGQGGCQADLGADCHAACNAEAALFCNDVLVDVGADLDQCVGLLAGIGVSVDNDCGVDDPPEGTGSGGTGSGGTGSGGTGSGGTGSGGTGSGGTGSGGNGTGSASNGAGGAGATGGANATSTGAGGEGGDCLNPVTGEDVPQTEGNNANQPDANAFDPSGGAGCSVGNARESSGGLALAALLAAAAHLGRKRRRSPRA